MGARARRWLGTGTARGRSWSSGGQHRRVGCRARSCILQRDGLSAMGMGTQVTQHSREGTPVPFCSTGRSFRSCLISSRIFSWSVLCFWGSGRSRRSDACGMHRWDLSCGHGSGMAPMGPTNTVMPGRWPVLALTCFRGGRERMKSSMSSWASFFTRGGMSPSTWGGKRVSASCWHPGGRMEGEGLARWPRSP